MPAAGSPRARGAGLRSAVASPCSQSPPTSPCRSETRRGFRGRGQVAAGRVEPHRYSHVLFVCGPIASAKVERLLRRFDRCRRIAVGVSVTPGSAGLFDETLPRDGAGAPRPDLSLTAPTGATPVVGVTLGHPQ